MQILLANNESKMKIQHLIENRRWNLVSRCLNGNLNCKYNYCICKYQGNKYAVRHTWPYMKTLTWQFAIFELSVLVFCYLLSWFCYDRQNRQVYYNCQADTYTYLVLTLKSANKSFIFLEKSTIWSALLLSNVVLPQVILEILQHMYLIYWHSRR